MSLNSLPSGVIARLCWVCGRIMRERGQLFVCTNSDCKRVESLESRGKYRWFNAGAVLVIMAVALIGCQKAGAPSLVGPGVDLVPVVVEPVDPLPESLDLPVIGPSLNPPGPINVPLDGFRFSLRGPDTTGDTIAFKSSAFDLEPGFIPGPVSDFVNDGRMPGAGADTVVMGADAEPL